MANRHFGNVGDIWKHLVLAEVLAHEHPREYWETHAGSASYMLRHSPAREYGIYWLLQRASASSAIRESRYWHEVGRLPRNGDSSAPAMYPGSSLLARRIRGRDTRYLFSDVDPKSTASVTRAAGELGLHDHARIVQADGLTAVREAAHDYEG